MIQYVLEPTLFVSGCFLGYVARYIYNNWNRHLSLALNFVNLEAVIGFDYFTHGYLCMLRFRWCVSFILVFLVRIWMWTNSKKGEITWHRSSSIDQLMVFPVKSQRSACRFCLWHRVHRIALPYESRTQTANVHRYIRNRCGSSNWN